MRVSIEKAPLLKALSHQQSLIERRGSVPVLSHVLLETQDAGVSFTGTDLEISLVEFVPAHIEDQGQVTVPVHLFYDIVRKFPDTHPIHIELTPEDQIRVSSGLIEFKIPTLPAEDFPRISPQDLPASLTIPAPLLKRLIEDTRFSMSTEETRYSLNGIYFHHHNNQWRAVATDAHRLALSWIPFNSQDIQELPSVIIGRKTIQEMGKLLDECTQEVSLSISHHQLVLSLEHCVFSSRLLEGQFPDYGKAIPEGYPYIIEIDVDALEQAISRVGMVSMEKQRVIKLDFNAHELTLSASSQQYGSAVEKMSIAYEAEPYTLGFNPKHFMDVCQHIKGKKVKMIFKDSLSPALFQDSQDPQVAFVLMPMRV
jgi:DNA polymerase-3 subunit beta